MPTINLLPWRERLREEKKREFLGMVGVFAVASMLLILLVHIAIGNTIGVEEKKNAYLMKEIKVLNKKIVAIKKLKRQRENLIARMQIIQELQTNRLVIVHLFDEMVRIIPDGVVINSIKRTDNNVTLKGIAESNARVSMLMRSINASDWLKNPKLTEIKSAKEKQSSHDFTLQLSVKVPKNFEVEGDNLDDEEAESHKEES